jgi:hypothetical protein
MNFVVTSGDEEELSNLDGIRDSSEGNAEVIGIDTE